jgi:hypothetical protein
MLYCLAYFWSDIATYYFSPHSNSYFCPDHCLAYFWSDIATNYISPYSNSNLRSVYCGTYWYICLHSATYYFSSCAKFYFHSIPAASPML